ncbi:MAG: hypothetical protein HY000_08100 [Planctomycetes bacterium]|nr:hypothetical protein [Planctomycetota bacterium]
MDDAREALRQNAETFARQRGIGIEQQLGFGIDGTVWGTTRKSVVKAHEREIAYCRERDVYYRLKDRGVTSIVRSSVPALIDYDDRLLVLEIEIVKPPWVIDFAHAYLDVPQDRSKDCP